MISGFFSFYLLHILNWDRPRALENWMHKGDASLFNLDNFCVLKQLINETLKCYKMLQNCEWSLKILYLFCVVSARFTELLTKLHNWQILFAMFTLRYQWITVFLMVLYWQCFQGSLYVFGGEFSYDSKDTPLWILHLGMCNLLLTSLEIHVYHHPSYLPRQRSR